MVVTATVVVWGGAGAVFALLAFGGLTFATVTVFLLSFSVSFFLESFIFEDADDKYSWNYFKQI